MMDAPVSGRTQGRRGTAGVHGRGKPDIFEKVKRYSRKCALPSSVRRQRPATSQAVQSVRRRRNIAASRSHDPRPAVRRRTEKIFEAIKGCLPLTVMTPRGP
jgi:hypothetical protein